MPIYEYRCRLCGNTSSFFLPTFSASPPSNCRHCDSQEIQRILSSFAYVKSEATKLQQLDPKYHKMVDQALAKAPAESDPNYYMRKMVPFSNAPEKGEPYFKE